MCFWCHVSGIFDAHCQLGWKTHWSRENWSNERWLHPILSKVCTNSLVSLIIIRSSCVTIIKIVVPLKILLKKNAFNQNDVVEQVFQYWKEASCTTPILTISNFNTSFILECDTSRKGIRVVWMQEGCPFTFTSKQLCDKNLGKLTYEKKWWIFFMQLINDILTWVAIINWLSRSS